MPSSSAWNKTAHCLTLKAPITTETAADDIPKNSFDCFSAKIRLDVSSDSSARQKIKDKKIKVKK